MDDLINPILATPLPTFRRGKNVLGHPEGEDLALINKFRPKGIEPYEPEQIVAAEFWASDNLIHRGNEKWSLNLLADIAEKAPGMPLQIDHVWASTHQHGTVYASEIHQLNRAPKSAIDHVGLAKQNREIIKSEGWIRVKMFAFFPATDGVVAALQGAQAQSVSTGGFVNNAVDVCGTCGKNIWLYEECSHLPPGWPLEWFASNDEEYEEAKKKTTPFTILTGDSYDAIELSITPTPALPNASMERAA